MANPKKVLQALEPDSITAAGLRLFPVTMATFILLEKLENPMVEGGSKITAEHMAQGVFILSRPIAETRALLNQPNGRAALDEAVMTFADSIPASELTALGKHISDHISAAVATITGGAGEKKTENM